MPLMGHPLDQLRKLATHLGRLEPNALTMAGQDPGELEVEQAPHRLGLPGPRIPAIIPMRIEPAFVPVVAEVIAGEEKTIVDEACISPRRGDSL